MAELATGQRAPRYSVRTAYLLLTLLGPFGAHKFYLGRPAAGLLYACTFGLFSVGTLVDLFTLPEQVRRANRRFAAEETFVPSERPSALSDPDAVIARYLRSQTDAVRPVADVDAGPTPGPIAFGRRRRA